MEIDSGVRDAPKDQREKEPPPAGHAIPKEDQKSNLQQQPHSDLPVDNRNATVPVRNVHLPKFRIWLHSIN